MSSAYRMPTVFISHGAGPCFWFTPRPPFAPNEFDQLEAHLRGLAATLSERPRAVLVITSHWETKAPTFSVNRSPGMLYDYYGFPPHTYELKYPAPGAPDLAVQARDMLAARGIAAAIDSDRGYDHGVFVPLLVAFPEADIPVLMMSVRQDFDPAALMDVGAALAPLRDEGVFIIGSGLSYHNTRIRHENLAENGRVWNDWLTRAATDPDPARRNAALVRWESAPFAREAHPREEHLAPLFVVAGAAGDDKGRRDYADHMISVPISGFAFG